MTFISYAQNYEDVLLWRALGHIKNGFYIDAGANDPVEHSVTRAFYDAGWHGINIEPLPAFHQLFEQQRPRDINLAIAAGAADGSLTLFDVPSVNGWASADRAVAEAHRAEGYEVRELTVPVRRLASVCAEHVRGDIHFLKIDVEGFEAEVLRGMDFVKWRPWLLVIEATMPNNRITNHETWETLVTSRGYTFAHFDGLNRYYAADEHADLLKVLEIQPNVFDDYISYHLDRAWRATEAASAAGAKAQAKLARAAHKQWEAEQRSDQASAAAREALAHSADLLARYDDAGKVLLAAQAANTDLQVQLARSAAAIDSQDAQLRALSARLEETNVRLQSSDQALLAAHVHAAEVHAATVEREKHIAEELTLREQVAQAQLAELQLRLNDEQAHRAALQREFELLGIQAHNASTWGRELEQRLLAKHASTSWRVTAPLRAAGTLVRHARASAPKAAAKRLLRGVIARASSSERMRRLLIPLLLRFPNLAARLSQVVQEIRQPDPNPIAAPAVEQVSDELRALPVSARNVLADLTRACGNHTSP